ncbi:ATP-dependent DNA helicase RecG [Leptotrichia trevisanii]|uniref:ATP-dependent DNA helicase RecG n=1 Tax=Leptotrichia trevisanii TaxID=109328 RepID=A0A510K7C0_9FUSO|nr:ATP-dependent DNA helicase RecG [Leptotrichia trevisanii]
MDMKENRELELKLIITNTFFKTVSAFANYGSGRIIFGIDDDGKVVGIEDLGETCLNLENKINDNIVPKPNFKFIKNGKNKTITLVIEEELDKPYLYKGKAYKKNDTSTIEVGRLELNRFTLEGMNQYFEKLKSNNQDLKFEALKKGNILSNK